MRSFLPSAGLSACLFLASLPAWSGPPDASKVRVASEEFEAGARAYKQKNFELAASHFEAADGAVPGVKALRLAMKARSEAGHGSRAATHAAQALTRYPDDADLGKLAKEILEKTEPVLHKVSVSCASPCVLAVGTRGIPGEATTRWVIYLDPGSATVSASFFGDSKGAQKSIEATAGGSSDVRFEPEASSANPPPKPPIEKPPVIEPPKNPVTPETPDPDKRSGSGISPAFFISALVATAAVGGVTIWSGVDTRNNPGPDAVRTACVGQGTSCPEYQDGLAKETRTNALIGATAGAGALTIVFAILTNWGGSESVTPPPEGAAGATQAPRAASRRAWETVRPAAQVGEGGAAVGVYGRF
jgi:hypothetical protein